MHRTNFIPILLPSFFLKKIFSTLIWCCTFVLETMSISMITFDAFYFILFFGYPNFHVNLVIYTWIIDRITEFSFIIFSNVIHFMKCFILSTMDYHVLFFHRYLLYIAFYYSYVNPFTVNPSGARVKNLVYIKFTLNLS